MTVIFAEVDFLFLLGLIKDEKNKYISIIYVNVISRIFI